jgi:hypothetical protein
MISHFFDKLQLTDVKGEFSVKSDESLDAFDWDTGTTGKVVLSLGGHNIQKIFLLPGCIRTI